MTLALGERDLWLAGLAGLVAAAAIALALSPAGTVGDPSTPVVARVRRADGEVKQRLALTLGWRGIARGAQVHDGDALFVPPGAEATIRFEDGTELALDERSLVVIERPRAGVRSVTLRQGSVSGKVAGAGLTLNTPAGETKLDAQTEARVEIQGTGKVEVAVKKGSARVKGKAGDEKAVAEGQRVAAAETGTTELGAWPVALKGPDAQARLPFRDAPAPMVLTWEGQVPDGARVQLARDRLFAFVDLERPAKGGELELKAPARGVTWWRLVDLAGQPLSEARRFTCVEDVAPVAMFPRDGEVVLAPLGTELSFSWTPLPGQSRYRVEISPSQEFEPVAWSQVVSGGTVRAKLELKEGAWFWRVRVEDEDGAGAPSEPRKFRVIHKAIPDAPELLNPEIEVTP